MQPISNPVRKNMKTNTLRLSLWGAAVLNLAVASPAFAEGKECASLGPDLDPANQNALFRYSDVRGVAAIHKALEEAVVEIRGTGIGLGNAMWLSLVDTSGRVCAVVNSAKSDAAAPAPLDQSWLGSRMISAQKAFAANAFSLSKGAPGTAIALSTANLYQPAQPGGSLYALEASNPVKTQNNTPFGYETALAGVYDKTNKKFDDLVGYHTGGVNVFGGGLAIYNSGSIKLGAIGVSGDTSCTDHAVAWIVRDKLGLDAIPGGPINGTDNMSFNKKTGFAHAVCSPQAKRYISTRLPAEHKIGP
jgi:uncharacterized protein GlcG (DUF336 family)